MAEYDYSKRISHNEKRIAELKGRIYTDKLTIKSLEEENKRCFEAMNNLTSPINTIGDDKLHISKLNKKIEKLVKDKNKLKTENTQLKHDLQATENLLVETEMELLNKSTKSEDLNVTKELANKNIFQDMLGKDLPICNGELK